MREELIIRYLSRRVEERGFTTYRMVYRDLNVGAGGGLELIAYNEIWFLLEAGPGIVVHSDYGTYDYQDPQLVESHHEHGDQIRVLNQSEEAGRVKFLQVILLD